MGSFPPHDPWFPIFTQSHEFAMEARARGDDHREMQKQAMKKFEEQRAPLRQIHEERLGLRGPGGGRQPGAPMNVEPSDYGSFDVSAPPSVGEPEVPDEVEHVPQGGSNGRWARRGWRGAQPIGEAAGAVAGAGLAAGSAILGGTASLLWHGGRAAADVYGNYMRGGAADEEEEYEPPAPPREPTRPPIERPGGVGGERAQPRPAFLMDRDEQGNANQAGGRFRPRLGPTAQAYAERRREAERRDREQGYVLGRG